MNKLVLIILSVLLPPVGVLLHKGVNKDFWLNLILTLIFFFPGMIHALYLLLSNPEVKAE